MNTTVLVSTWRQMAHGFGDVESPEATVTAYLTGTHGHTLPGQALAAVYDVIAMQATYRRTVTAALPEGLLLRGNTFWGPAVGEMSAGQYVTDNGTTLDQLYAARIAEAMWGADDNGGRLLEDLADRFRITSDTTTRVYATWQATTGEQDPEATVTTGLNQWGYRNVESLADSGLYDNDHIDRALRGLFGHDAALVAQVTAGYRTALADALPDGFAVDGSEICGPHPRIDIDLPAAVRTADLQQVISHALAAAPSQLWTT